jgi:Sec-independent protein translocase protein TatA
VNRSTLRIAVIAVVAVVLFQMAAKRIPALGRFA